MEIADVRVILLGFGEYCNYVLIKIVAADGTFGWGDASLIGRETAVASTLSDYFIPLLVGRDPLDSEDIWQTLFRGGYWRGGPILMSAIAGVDMALWDLKGKIAGLPVYQLLGGRCRDRVLTYGHASGAGLTEIEESARSLIERGYRVIRCQGSKYGWAQGGEDPRSNWWANAPDSIEVETFDASAYLRAVPMMFEHLRNALGDKVELCHDAHQRLTASEAAQLAKRIEPYSPYFLEDPLRPEQAQSLRDVRLASVTPLAMGELFHSLHDCLPLLSQGLVDFIRCDVAHSGGITEARRIATVADAFGVRTAWHGPSDISPIAQAASVHLDVAIPNFGVQEFAGYPQAVQDVIQTGVSFKDGFLHLSGEPGLGVNVQEDLLDRFPYSPHSLPMARRLDGSLQDW